LITFRESQFGKYEYLKKEHGNFRIKCSREELIVLSNALNNIPQAVDEQEYTTLIGASKTDTHKVLNAIVEALNQPSD
jgi:hypothetical protein